MILCSAFINYKGHYVIILGAAQLRWLAPHVTEGDTGLAQREACRRTATTNDDSLPWSAEGARLSFRVDIFVSHELRFAAIEHVY